MGSIPVHICSVDGCEGKHEAKGFCNKHYLRFWKHGSAEVAKLTICSVDGCNKKIHGRSLCAMHYRRVRVFGTVESKSGATLTETFVDRFWAKVNKDGPVHPKLGTPCWLWKACKKTKGYGSLRYRGKSLLAHRFSYELCGHIIPEGLELDHLCRNTSCVNPDHLEPVSGLENMRRARATRRKEKKLCSQGHVYDKLHKKGTRVCSICNREAERRHRAKKRQDDTTLITNVKGLE